MWTDSRIAILKPLLNFPLHNTELLPNMYVNFFTDHQMHVLRHVFDLFDFFYLFNFRTLTISELSSSRKWTSMEDASELPYGELDARTMPRFWLYYRTGELQDTKFTWMNSIFFAKKDELHVSH